MLVTPLMVSEIPLDLRPVPLIPCRMYVKTGTPLNEFHANNSLSSILSHHFLITFQLSVYISPQLSSRQEIIFLFKV